MVKTIYENIQPIKEYVDTLRLDKSPRTIEYYLDSIDRFFSFLEVKIIDDIAKITSTNCREYQAELKKNGLRASSINAHIRALKALFNWLLENQYIDNSPFDKVKYVKEIKKEAAYMSLDEINLFFSHCKNPEEKAMFALFIRLGLRREELIGLKFKNISGYNVTVLGKGNKIRILSIPDDAFELFQVYVENRQHNNDDYIFISNHGNKYTGTAIHFKFKAIMKRANFSEQRIKELHVHSLRHTFTANFMEDGNDIKVAQMVLGHSSLSTTEKIYAHIRNSLVESSTRNQKRIINNEF